MAFDRSPQCPACGSDVSIRLAWAMVPKNRVGLLAHGAAVVCPKCGTKLRIVQWPSLIAIVCIWATFATLWSFVGAYARPLGNAVIVPILASTLLLMLLTNPIARRFAKLRIRVGSDVLDFPVESLKEQLSTAGQPVTDDAEVLVEGDTSQLWSCIKCGAATPSTSAVCQKCGAYNANAI
jgi:ribosomal protein L40E